MSFADLQHEELALVGRALQLMATGEVVQEWEFGTRIGLPLQEFRSIAGRWRVWSDSSRDPSEDAAINNTFNELLNGIGMSDEQYRTRLGAGRSELEQVFCKWKRQTQENKDE